MTLRLAVILAFVWLNYVTARTSSPTFSKFPTKLEICKYLCPQMRNACPPYCPAAPQCPPPACPQPHCPAPICPGPVCPPVPQCPTVTCPRCASCPECSRTARVYPKGHTRGISHSALLSCPRCPPVSAPTASKSLPEGYEEYPYIGAYKYYTERTLWIDANVTCNRDGGHLAIPDSELELSIILKIISEHGHAKKNVYVGFHDYIIENTFTTVLGQEMTRFHKSLWSIAYPIDLPGPNGVMLNEEGKLWYMGNFIGHSFICELKDS